jgi:HK97 family phage major capsid protein
MWEELIALAKNLAERGMSLKGYQEAGVSSKEDLGVFLNERDKWMEDCSKFLKDLPSELEQKFTEVTAALENMKKSLKESKTIDKELEKKDVAMAFAKAALFSIKGMGAFSGDNPQEDMKKIIRPGELSINDKGRINFGAKAATATELAPGTTQAGYIILPVYEREIIKYAAEKSDLMGMTREMPMFAPQHSYPVFSGRSITKTRTSADSSGTAWSAASKMAAASDGPSWAARVTMLATTLATYIPWIDEFEDDIQINESLAALMLECWTEAFGIDFDDNMLVADSSLSAWEYDGLLKEAGKSFVIGASSVAGMSPDKLLNIPQQVSRMERDGLIYLLHETVLSEMMKKKNAVGDYLFWTPPVGDKPAKLGGYSYQECNRMPSLSEIEPGDTFMTLVNPDNMWYGLRAGLDIRMFDGTMLALEYQQNFVRYRIRNAFKQVKTDNAVNVKLSQ